MSEKYLHTFEANPDNKSAIHPKGYTLLIKPLVIENKTESGIIMRAASEEDKAQMAQVYGVVIEIGPCAWDDEPVPRAKVGENVVFRRYSGEQFTGNDGEKYRVILDKDVYATKD